MNEEEPENSLSYCSSPELLLEEARRVPLNQLPPKSRTLYERIYNEFKKWCSSNDISTLSEEILLKYFTQQSKKYKPSSLWTHYSMLKATLMAKENVDVSDYKKVIAFLKSQNTGFKPKKSKILNREQIAQFFLEAPDDDFLMSKIVLMMGIAGACRREELCKLSLDDVDDVGSALIVKIRKSKTEIARTFMVVNNDELNYLDMYRRYIGLRPGHTEHRRLFVYYKTGKCTTQVVGKNTISQVPQQVAKFLKLKDPNEYTGHCFRRSSANLLANGQRSDIFNFSCYSSYGTWNPSAMETETNGSDHFDETKIKIDPDELVEPTETNTVSGEQNHNINHDVDPPDGGSSEKSMSDDDYANFNDDNGEALLKSALPGFSISKCKNFTVNIHFNVKK